MRITKEMSLPKEDIEAKKVLMEMNKEDIIDRHFRKAKTWVASMCALLIVLGISLIANLLFIASVIQQ